MKKLISFGLVLGILLSFNGVTLAKDNIIFDTQSSTILASWGNEIGEFGGEIECHAFTNAYGYHDLYIKMELQKYNDSWSTIQTWEKSRYDSMLDLIAYYPLLTGIYRIKSTHEAGEESKVIYGDSYIVN